MRVLLLGGTGAMGVHLSSVLSARGDDVAVTTRRKRDENSGVSYITGNAQDGTFLSAVLDRGWDAVVDFMVRPSAGFPKMVGRILAATDQYVFVSSYRVYADAPILTEGSPRLLDVCDDRGYLATDEYALAKARCEDVLAASGRGNWTVVRPGITYDGSGRFQLGTLEAGTWLLRAMSGLPVLFPDEMLGKTTTLSWGGDVARMIAGLVGNPAALGEAYTVATSESLMWGEVAGVYREVAGLELSPCSLEEYERVTGGHYQIAFDRMFDRRIDNTKVLAATGIVQTDILPVRERLASELDAFLREGTLPKAVISHNARMDRFLGGFRSLRPIVRSRPGIKTATAYAVRRFL